MEKREQAIPAPEQSGKEEYGFCAALVQLMRPQKILEVGTSSGRGTLALAQNSPSGAEIVTIDCADHRNEAIKNFPPDNIRIRFIQKNSDTALQQLVANGEHFDLILIDGGHLYETVTKDWSHARQLAETIIFHDALQFNGVKRVINKIRRDPCWDVSVLSYPGTSLFDDVTGKEFYSNRCPGIAIATKRNTHPNKLFKNFLEHPTKNSRTALKRREKIFQAWHAEANRAHDLSFSDWEMIFHTLWNLNPDAIAHLGHIGTDATLIFLEYARAKNKAFLGLDPTGKFWSRKKNSLPQRLAVTNSAVIFEGRHSIKEASAFVRKHQKVLLWVDEYYDESLYKKPIQQLLKQLPKGSAACIRNFSPHNGSPERMVIAGSECTNPRAYSLCKWLQKQPYPVRLASPEATFGDYINAGHWIVIQDV